MQRSASGDYISGAGKTDTKHKEGGGATVPSYKSQQTIKTLDVETSSLNINVRWPER